MAIYKNTCPRCGGFFEKLSSYAHCSSCLYYEDYWSDSESDFYQAMKTAKEIIRLQEEEERLGEGNHEDKDCA